MVSNKKIIIFTTGVCFIVFYLVVFFLGNFSSGSHATIAEEYFTINENLYFGKQIIWKGLFKPTITRVELRHENSDLHNQEDDNISVSFFIDTAGHTGLLREKTYQEMVSKNLIEYISAENYKVKTNDFTLVKKARRLGESYTKHYGYIVIYYRYMGLPKKQAIGYNGFVTKNSPR